MIYSIDELEIAQNSIASTIRKSEKVIQTISQKNSSRVGQINMVKNRLFMFYTAAALISKAMKQDSIYTITNEGLIACIEMLPPITEQVQQMLPKFKEGSSQHTLAIRRIKAFDIAIALAKEDLQIIG